MAVSGFGGYRGSKRLAVTAVTFKPHLYAPAHALGHFLGILECLAVFRVAVEEEGRIARYEGSAASLKRVASGNANQPSV